MKHHRFFLLTLTLLLLASSPALAQNAPRANNGSIRGKVVSQDNGDPIPTTTVALWRSADSTLVTGAVTLDDGQFVVEGLKPDAYYARISFVGYESRLIDNIEVSPRQWSVDLGLIELIMDSQMMDEVEVVSTRDFIEVGIDRTVYNTSNQLVSAGGTASNVLENIPSVEVDIEGNVSLRGSQNVAILINGRPSPMTGEALTSYLQGLPAEVVERVEVIPNPSAKYEPDGMAGILNIVLKQNKDLGVSGALSSSVDSQGSYNVSGNVAYQKGRVGLFAGYGFRYGSRDSEGWRFRENRFTTPYTLLDQESFDNNVGISHNLNTSFDYNLGNRSSLTLSSRLSVRGGDNSGLTSYSELGAPDLLTSRYDRNTAGVRDDLSTQYRLSYKKVFEPGKHELNAEVQFEQEWGNDSGDYSQSVYDIVDLSQTSLLERQRDLQDDSGNEASIVLDYMHPLGEQSRFEAGFKSEFERLNSDFYTEDLDASSGLFIPNLQKNNTFAYDQQIHAAYGILGTKLGRVGLQAGVRLEQALTNFNLETTRESFENNYISAFPSAYAVYEFSETQSLKLAYSKRINRPRTGGRFNQLNPFNSNEDPLYIRVGNPYLKPEYVHAFELSFTRFSNATSITLTPYFRHTVDEIRFYETLREDGVTVTTFENFDSSNSWGTEIIGTYKQGRRFNAYASFNVFRVVTDGSSVDTGLSNKAIGFSSRANATYNISPSMDVQFSYFYRAPMNIENGRMAARQSADLAIRQKLMGDRANLSLRVRDVFNTMGFYVTREDARFFQEINRSFQSQSVGLSFSYNFGRQQNNRRNNRNRDMEQEGGFDELEMQ